MSNNVLINIGAKTGQAVTEINRVNKALGDQLTSAEKTKNALAKMQGPALAALAAIGAGAYAAGKMASDQEQAFGALSSVYKGSADQMQRWAKQQSAIGLSAAQAGNAAALLGSQLKNAGFRIKEAGTQSQALVALGADLAATFGGDAASAVDSLSAALKGEYDSMEKYGTSLSASKVQQEALTLGLWAGKGAMDESARAAATLSLINKQTADSQGQSSREADTFAGAQGRALAQVQNLGAELGTALLPFMASAADSFGRAATFATEHTGAIQIGAVVVASFASAIIAANLVLKLHTAWTNAVTVASKIASTATRAWSAGQWLLNAAMTANPIGLVVAAIALLVGGLVLAYNKSDKFRAIVDSVWRGLKTLVSGGINTVKDAFSGLSDALSAAWSWMQKLIDKAGALADKLNPLKGLSSLIGRADTSAARYSPSISPLGRASGTSIGTLIYHGTGDISADGRTLRAMLESGDIQQGRPAGAPRRVAW